MAQKKKMFQNVGQFLREKREERNLSQTEVADSLDVKPQFVSNWERGMSSPPLRMLRQIMKIYSIPDEELLEFMLHQQEEYLRQQLGLKRRKA